MTSETGFLLLLGLLSFLLLWFGWQRGFFYLPLTAWKVPIRAIHLVLAFAIYFAATFAPAVFLVPFLKNQMLANRMAYMTWFHFLSSALIAGSLFLYMKWLAKPISQGIWEREKQPISKHASSAFFTLILAFPLVIFLTQVLELFVQSIFHIPELPEQLAVLFLKATFHYPLYLTLALIAILLFAPFIEELLFRGFMQTFIRKHLGPKQAIFITSSCFALFHYAAGQGLGNIPILISLFIFALFLGLIYEKQGSLIAPMFLHSLFNGINVLNLYLMQES